jgi:hypothetical protein
MIEREEYWQRAEKHRAETGKLPDWVFDFVSVHELVVFPKWGEKVIRYGLHSPMLLVDKVTGYRPKWEDEKWETKKEAVREARKLAREHGVWVVDCH